MVRTVNIEAPEGRARVCAAPGPCTPTANRHAAHLFACDTCYRWTCRTCEDALFQPSGSFPARAAEDLYVGISSLVKGPVALGHFRCAKCLGDQGLPPAPFFKQVAKVYYDNRATFEELSACLDDLGFPLPDEVLRHDAETDELIQAERDNAREEEFELRRRITGDVSADEDDEADVGAVTALEDLESTENAPPQPDQAAPVEDQEADRRRRETLRREEADARLSQALEEIGHRLNENLLRVRLARQDERTGLIHLLLRRNQTRLKNWEENSVEGRGFTLINNIVGKVRGAGDALRKDFVYKGPRAKDIVPFHTIITRRLQDVLGKDIVPALKTMDRDSKAPMVNVYTQVYDTSLASDHMPLVYYYGSPPPGSPEIRDSLLRDGDVLHPDTVGAPVGTSTPAYANQWDVGLDDTGPAEEDHGEDDTVLAGAGLGAASDGIAELGRRMNFRRGIGRGATSTLLHDQPQPDMSLATPPTPPVSAYQPATQGLSEGSASMSLDSPAEPAAPPPRERVPLGTLAEATAPRPTWATTGTTGTLWSAPISSLLPPASTGAALAPGGHSTASAVTMAPASSWFTAPKGPDQGRVTAAPSEGTGTQKPPPAAPSAPNDDRGAA